MVPVSPQQWNVRAGRSAFPGKCVDLDQNNRYNGAKIQSYDCNGTDAQHWSVQGNGEIKLAGTDFCLDAWAGQGSPVRLWGCNGTAAQRW
ncbi:ricin-type beta-trefoil lectin domain protein [Longispora fulva]|uniref:Ricin B lectin domain-containing protein n=1 Tax=Longispora fulva TaxID=619741 RepID=A0A8J7KUB0_9ACTN|nr:ricin-type beta-trefoil lectin domain protein [Longispora fulva]MBG6133877.1 hypothetical protein [Longispora fulva]